MKSTYLQMMEDPGFKKFMELIRYTANYFAAAQGREDTGALDLCLAYAYKSGKEGK